MREILGTFAFIIILLLQQNHEKFSAFAQGGPNVQMSTKEVRNDHAYVTRSNKVNSQADQRSYKRFLSVSQDKTQKTNYLQCMYW